MVDPFLGHPPDHHRLGATVAFEDANPLVDPDQADGGEHVAVRAELVFQRLTRQGRADHPMAGGLHAAGGFDGQSALAGYQA